jgi:SAM-dependent methyltransferase
MSTSTGINLNQANNDNNQPAIEPDAYDDGDSTFGEGPRSDTTSLASSVWNYTYENGRRYHAYRHGEYPLPNDEAEQDRLDLMHHLHKLILDGNIYLAPIGKNIHRAYDVGTGTGIWAIDFADEHPSAEVIGTDLSPIQPRWVPPNLRFEIDDAESEWAHGSKFDFIHLRTLGGSIKDVPKLLRQAYDNLHPGGWIEWQEYEMTIKADDDSLPEKSAMVEWIDTLNKASSKFGKLMNIAPTLKSSMEQTGFVNAVDKAYKVPIGPWAKDEKLKELGRWNFLTLHDSLPAYTLRLFTHSLGWKKEEAEIYIAKVKNELMDRSIHAYGTFHFIYAQKPQDT